MHKLYGQLPSSPGSQLIVHFLFIMKRKHQLVMCTKYQSVNLS